MKSYHIKRVVLSNSRGGTLILVAILLSVFIGVTALSIDIGYLSTTKNELQNVADAAALAGAGYLGNVYMGLSSTQHATHTFTRAEIVTVIQTTAGKNKAGVSISINDDEFDIKIGLWNPDTLNIDTETLQGPDAVYVKARRDGEANSPISTFFAGIFGIDTMPVSADAVAALSGPSVVAEGELVIPIGISEKAFPNDCKDLIYFSPTPYSCAGWTNFEEDKISDQLLSEKIFNLIVSDECQFCGSTTDEGLTQDGDTWLHDNFTPKNLIENNLNTDDSTPTTAAGVDFNFIGGETDQFNGHYLVDYDGNTGTPYANDKELTLETATAPSPIFSLFDYFRYRDGDGDVTVREDIYAIDGTTLLYSEGHIFDKNAIWSTTVPVYKDNENVTCEGVGTNVGGMTEIVGFAKVVVIQPNPPPAKDLNVMIECEFTVVDGRSGGGIYGDVKGSIPNLVQ